MVDGEQATSWTEETWNRQLRGRNGQRTGNFVDGTGREQATTWTERTENRQLRGRNRRRTGNFVDGTDGVQATSWTKRTENRQFRGRKRRGTGNFVDETDREQATLWTEQTEYTKLHGVTCREENGMAGCAEKMTGHTARKLYDGSSKQQRDVTGTKALNSSYCVDLHVIKKAR